MKVLFLSEWYPNRYDAMLGLFVRKHAEAVARLGVETYVLYLHPDKKVRGEEIVEQTTHGVHELYIYYSGSFLHALYSGYRLFRRQYGQPDLCQLNVITKNGLLPLYLKLTRGIPYIIVEHWSGYLPQNFSIRGGWHKRLMQTICRHASCVLPVSNKLREAMIANGFQNSHFALIHNVVDDFFYPSSSTSASSSALSSSSSSLSLLHVSCFDEKAKNIRGLLRAVREVARERQDFVLTLVGTGVDFQEDQTYAESLDFPQDMLVFTGEQTPEQVSEYMCMADFFLMFSRYENAPVVLSECMATGLPILTSAAGGIPEMVTDQVGILVPVEDEVALANQLRYMLDHHGDFSRDTIRQEGMKYSYDAVGKELLAHYTQAISRSY